jgi:hypothetical protein
MSPEPIAKPKIKHKPNQKLINAIALRPIGRRASKYEGAFGSDER